MLGACGIKESGLVGANVWVFSYQQQKLDWLQCVCVFLLFLRWYFESTSRAETPYAHWRKEGLATERNTPKITISS